jgi:hypothetical protein
MLAKSSVIYLENEMKFTVRHGNALTITAVTTML